MGMYESIKSFHTQFVYKPEIENQNRLKKHERFIVVGMGGSHLAADLLKVWNPYSRIWVHWDYGLPPLSEETLKKSLVIANSYSGNTEEAIDAYEQAREKNLSVAAVSIGGKLLELAKKDGVPYVQMPDTGIQPRMSIGFNFKALLKLMNEEDALEEVNGLAHSLQPSDFEDAGRKLAERLRGFVPLIYSSRRNQPIAYTWKIKCNETGKIPAFYNMLPEMNHNEMTGFDIAESTRQLSKNFYFILLRDSSDHPKVQKRMEALSRLYHDRGLAGEMIEIDGKNTFHKIFSSLILADWTAYYLGKSYGVETNEVPMVEEFKKLI